MNYIVLDMEWNQPYGKAGLVSEPVLLHGEIIRIGAVKLDENLNELSKHHGCVIPKYYKRMNSSVGRVTGLGSRAITYGLKFPAAYRAFLEWCGEDCIILTWGSEDERIMLANLAVHNISAETLPKFYDLQIIFSHRILQNGKQYGLQAALEHYCLEQDLKAHDALNDAIYTSRIAIKMDFVKYLDEYSSIIEEMEKKRNEKYIKTFMNVPSIEEAMSRKDILVCRCHKCKRLMKVKKWAYRRADIAVSCASCRNHGEYYVKLKFTLCPDNTYAVTRTVKPMTAEYKEIYDKAAAASEEEKVPYAEKT